MTDPTPSPQVRDVDRRIAGDLVNMIGVTYESIDDWLNAYQSVLARHLAPEREEAERLRKAIESAADDISRMGFQWMDNTYGLKSQGGRGLFLRTTHVEERLRDALSPAPAPQGERGGA